MFYYLYQITNLVNNKIYVGVHKTKNINDGYMGSGKVIKDAIAKHGIDNFRKDILEHFDNSDAMYAREKEIVSSEFLLREDVYNLRRGGNGGFDHIRSRVEYLESQRKGAINGAKSNLTNKDSTHWKKLSKSGTEALLKKIKDNNGIWWDTKSFLGKSHSDETKKKMSNSQKGKHVGEKNSQFGTMWINNGEQSKKIKKYDIIPEGWNKGRKIK